MFRNAVKKNITLLETIGFLPKENTNGIFIKEYANNYYIEIDTVKNTFHFGGKIKVQGKDFQNITKPEDWVVLECVNRLLETGYKPETISLEKVYPTGHGTSGRLDICVTKDEKTYLMIECKTYGAKFDIEYKNIKQDGGQLFTYFQQDKDAEILMLYASHLHDNKIVFVNQIIKIEEEYRSAANVKDFYNKWNKLTTESGVWENPPYNFKVNKFTKANLKELTEEISKTIFHSFASILRKHSVSDKPNAFNKIFNLFLAKLFDEAKRDDDELDFHWRENDNPVDFQIRLIDLHKKGLFDFLKKEIEGIDDSDFQAKTPEEIFEKKKKYLKFNNVFAIKDVLNDADFDENQRVLKDVVQLLEKYRIRYPRKQQHLSDFFEKLLTTGLKQEVGQYFTPPPVTKFIIRSLPLQKMIAEEINNETPKLPAIIDYAAGSGHFITEALEEYQDIINNIDTKGFFPKAIKAVEGWKADPYEWAAKYVYGIEKDYRLVKVAKVGCYFYGDGVAQIIHGDGLDSFATSKTYVGLLKENTNLEDSTKAKFSIVVSNPPYSVNDCKDDLEYIKAEKEFTLYNSLTDKSKDIECLFVERTKHLLKDGGVASLILPSSILNSSGIQTKTREILLQYFDVVAIAELGSNTFMATNTNTVTLFLRRRNNVKAIEWKNAVTNFFETYQDNIINGITTPVVKYINYVWNNEASLPSTKQSLSITDYTTLLQKTPNEKIQQHELYKEYRKKIKARTEKEFYDKLLNIEADKLFYFIITLNQQIVLVKSGDKEAEKRFLGYDFSNRRNSEGMHSMQRGKSIDQCTKMYNPTKFDDGTKASTYIYEAFHNNYKRPIDESLQNNITRHNLVDMLTFDRIDFEKTISLSVKKKIIVESKWDVKRFDEVAQILRGVTYSKEDQSSNETNKIVLTADNISLEGNFEINKKVYLYEDVQIDEDKKLKANDIFICFSSGSKEHLGKVAFINNNTNYYAGGFMGIIRIINGNEPKYLFQLLNTILRQPIRDIGSGSNINNLSGVINDIKIPLPPLDIQQQIVEEVKKLELVEGKAKKELKELKEKLISLSSNNLGKSATLKKLGEVCDMKAGKFVSAYDIKEIFEEGLYPCFGGNGQRGYTSTFTHDGKFPLIGRQGALCGNVCMAQGKFHATEHAVVVAPAKDINIDWLYHQLINMNLNQYATGTAQPGLSVENLKNVSISVPSLSQQQKIVSQIQTIEQKITQFQNSIASIPQQKEAILKKYL